MTASTTEAMFNTPHPRIVRFHARGGKTSAARLPSTMQYKHPSVPLNMLSVIQGKAESYQLYLLLESIYMRKAPTKAQSSTKFQHQVSYEYKLDLLCY
jgi:hypothetical protein